MTRLAAILAWPYRRFWCWRTAHLWQRRDVGAYCFRRCSACGRVERLWRTRWRRASRVLHYFETF